MKQIEGWLNVYKPLEISSFNALYKIKKKFNLNKIGHAGTLDPLAEGILPLALGQTTRLIPYINDQVKEYQFEIKWGERTSTDDKEGEIVETSDIIPDKMTIQKTLDRLKGTLKQIPPKASAIKINGQRAYKLFRKNINFEMKKRTVKLFEAKIIEQTNNNISKINIKCGKGFYVRSFARDLGEILNTKAHIFSLKRTKVGNFTLNNSILLDDLLKISEMTPVIRGFHKSLKMLDDILAIEIDNDEIIKDISNGKKIKLDINLSLKKSENKEFFLKRDDSLISFGIFDGIYFRPKKVFI